MDIGSSKTAKIQVCEDFFVLFSVIVDVVLFYYYFFIFFFGGGGSLH